MISASKRRLLADRLTAVGVRATSLLVLAAVVGMLLQLIVAALPLMRTPEVELNNSAELVQQSSETIPNWVPRDQRDARWQVLGERGLWFAIGPSGLLSGQVGGLAGQDLDPIDYTLPPLDIGKDAALSLVNSPRNSLLIVQASGQYSFRDGTGTVSFTGQTAPFDRVHILPGDAGFLGVKQNIIEHWHWVRAGDIPLFRLRQRMQLAAGVNAVAIDPAAERILALLDNDTLEVRSILSGENIVSVSLAETAEHAYWVDRHQIGVAFSQGHFQHWKIAGDINGIDAARLLQPIVYPGYPEARSVWQPLSATLGNPAKLNVVPLLLGTFKTAALALLFAVPIATGAATFVGYFMTPSYRNRIKPIIEMIAAFPTVVIGAIFAVSVAPSFWTLSAHWLGALLVTPCAIALAAFVFNHWGSTATRDGWLSKLPLLLVLPGCALIALGSWLGYSIESRVWDGNLIAFLALKTGLDHQSHNSLLVAFAMGFAIIPSIFTVAEDAINSVPRSLGAGSLALGASQWQSFASVVLPVALPGIVAAVLLGFGRAIGETMILLMLSGNAPNTGLNPFTAVRSIAATLAIELPDAAVASAHFQVLILVALLLFAVSFVFNTIAQLLKRRLMTRMGQVT